MKTSSGLRRGAHVLAAATMLATLLAIGVAAAPSASSFGTEWRSPFAGQNWRFVTQEGELVLVGNGGNLTNPTAPFQCSNGRNDDASIVSPNQPPAYQDANADFPADVQCGSATDDSEAQAGIQNRSPIAFNGVLQANGSITSPALTFDTLYQYTDYPASGVIIIAGALNSPVVPPAVTNISANLDPTNGVGTLQLQLKFTVTVPTPVGAQPCEIAPVNLNMSTTNPGGSNYDPATGLMTLVDDQWTLPASTGPGGIVNLCPDVSAGFGLPGQPGQSLIRLTMKAVPNVAPPAPTVSAVASPPAPQEGQQVTLTPTGSSNYQVPCSDPAPAVCPTPPTSYNWGWTQTSGPAVSDLDIDPITGVATFVVPDNGAYQFQVRTQNGGSTSLGPNVGTVNFTATGVAPTVDAGPHLTVSGGLAAGENPQRLVGAMTDPAPADVTGRTTAWSVAPAGPGNTCSPAAGAVVVTSPSSLNSTFSTGAVASDCVVQVTLEGSDKDGLSDSDFTQVFVKAAVAGRINGVVTARPGSTPLEGATVVIYTSTGPSLSFYDAEVTDGDGFYQFSSVPPGNYKLFFTRSGYAPQWLGGTSEASRSPAVPNTYATADQDLWSTTGGTGTLSGTVTATSGGNVSNGTSVRLYNDLGYVAQTTTTGGSYSFSNLPPGQYRVLAGFGVESPVDYLAKWADNGLTFSSATPKSVPQGGTATVNISLPKAPVAANSTGTSTGATTTVLTDATPGKQAWAVNQWSTPANSWRLRYTTGPAANTSRVITSNTATTITTAAFAAAPGAGAQYVIEPNSTTGPGSGQSTSATTKPILGDGRNAIGDSTKSWTPSSVLPDANGCAPGTPTGGLVGHRVRITGGPQVGSVRTILCNDATVLVVDNRWVAAPPASSTYIIEAPDNGAVGMLQGGVARADTGATVPANQTEVRVYNATTGSFVGRTLVGQNLPGALPGVSYSFFRWTADPAFPNQQSGLPPGSYKVLFRVIGTGGTAPALCSQWNGGLNGGPNTGAWQFSPAVSIPAGGNVNLSAQLDMSNACVPFN